MVNFVQIYKSTDTGAPTLAGTAGSLINVLNKCLVSGYTTASVTALSRVGSVATATIASTATLVTGNYVTISGANEVDYNGTFQITVTDTTHFTYTVANSPTTPATGTLLYAKAGLGWASPFTATNVATYRSSDNSSNRFYLRVQETGVTAGGQKEVSVVGYEVMQDANTGQGQFPTTAQKATGLCWAKSITADATTRAWTIIGDDKTFYIQLHNGTNPWMGGFGHYISYKPGDGFNTFIAGMDQFNVIVNSTLCSGIGTNGAWGSLLDSNQAFFYTPRSWTQVGGPVSCTTIGAPSYQSSAKIGMGVYSPTATTWGPSFPNGPDMGMYFWPLWVIEATQGLVAIKGKLPGMYGLGIAALPQHANYEVVNGLTNLPGISLVALTLTSGVSGTSTTYSGIGFWDYVGPWA